MTERLFLRLSNGWALGANGNQWIVLRAKMRRGERRWDPVGYVGSTKTVLRRVLREKRAEISDEALRTIDAMPESFLDWIHRQEQRIAA